MLVNIKFFYDTIPKSVTYHPCVIKIYLIKMYNTSQDTSSGSSSVLSTSPINKFDTNKYMSMKTSTPDIGYYNNVEPTMANNNRLICLFKPFRHLYSLTNLYLFSNDFVCCLKTNLVQYQMQAGWRRLRWNRRSLFELVWGDGKIWNTCQHQRSVQQAVLQACTWHVYR